MNRSSRNRRFSSRFGLSSNSRLNEAEADGSTLSIDFWNWNNLNRNNDNLIFTRGSTASFFGSNGLLQFAGAGVPRFDHYVDNFQGGQTQANFRGLLLEGQSTNLACFSETFSTVGGTNNWTYNGQTTSVGGGANPSTASGLTFQFRNTVANATTQPLQLDVTVSAGIHTFSIWLHGSIFNSINTTTAVLAVFQGGSPVTVLPQVICGSGVTVSGLTYVTVGNLQALTSPTNPGSYARVQLTTTALVAGTASLRIYPQTEGTQVLNSSVYVYGAQFEQRTNASSYIQTTTTQATRIADQIQFRSFTPGAYGINASSDTTGALAPRPGYTLLMNAMILRLAETNYPRIMDFADSGSATIFGLFFGNPDAAGTRYRGAHQMFAGGYFQEPNFQYIEPVPAGNTFETVGFTGEQTMIGSTFTSFRSGTLRQSFADLVNPDLNLPLIFSGGINRTQFADYPIVWIRWFKYFPYRISDNDMIRLTFNPNWR